MEAYKPVFPRPKKKVVVESIQQPIKQKPKLIESKRIPHSQSKPRIQEKEKVHIDSVINLSDQIKKYLERHGKDKNINSVITDISIGLYLGVANYYANDNDESTSGVDILSKIIDKTKAIMKEHPELDSEKDVEADFDLEDESEDDEGSEGEYPVEDEVASNNEIEEESEDEEDIPDEEDVEEDEDEDEEDKKKKSKKESVEPRKKFSYSGRGLKLHTEAWNRPKDEGSDEVENIDLERFLENDSSVDEFK